MTVEPPTYLKPEDEFPRLDALLAEQTARHADMALDLDAAALAGLA